MQHLLIFVDMQNDFITGALGTPEAQAILPRVVEKVKAHQGPVLFTRDSHGPDYLNTGKGGPCPLLVGTDGWQIAGVEAL